MNLAEPIARTVTADSVDAAKRGDEEAFSAVVATFHRDLARVTYAITGDHAAAEEAEQSAWTLAWRRLPSLRDHDRLRPWLVAIAANEARRLIRGAARRRIRELVVAPGTTSEDRDHAAGVDLANALARLDATDRTLLVLRIVAGLDAVETGRALGMRPGTVRVRQHRLLARLREELDHD
jgi:RNA polymerase sigma-70 factor (ECF subfamily)